MRILFEKIEIEHRNRSNATKELPFSKWEIALSQYQVINSKLLIKGLLPDSQSVLAHFKTEDSGQGKILTKYLKLLFL